MARKPMLLDTVLGKVRNNKGGQRSWFQRLPPDAQQELEAVRQSFNPALHQKRAFALAIIEAAKERGWEIAKEKQVIEWLDVPKA
jgi:cysteine synthase